MQDTQVTYPLYGRTLQKVPFKEQHKKKTFINSL